MKLITRTLMKIHELNTPQNMRKRESWRRRMIALPGLTQSMTAFLISGCSIIPQRDCPRIYFVNELIEIQVL
jgi:hypothetical protein